jgi:F-type H+-transporting ATPase subunit delta
VELIVSVVAKRYAKALVALAKEHGRLAETGRDLKRLVQLIEATPELQALLYNPCISRRFKDDLLADVAQRLRIGPLELNFVRLLLEKGRLPQMPQIVALYEELAEAAQNRLRVRVKSARPLPPALQEEVRRRFAQYTSKDIVIEQEIDAALIGGIVAQMGSLVLDGSIRNELLRIKAELVGDHQGGLA